MTSLLNQDSVSTFNGHSHGPEVFVFIGVSGVSVLVRGYETLGNGVGSFTI